jgi:hypothetical protein
MLAVLSGEKSERRLGPDASLDPNRRFGPDHDGTWACVLTAAGTAVILGRHVPRCKDVIA